MLKLVKLTKEYKTQLVDMLEEWTTYNNTHPVTNHSPWMIFRNDYHDFNYYLDNLEIKSETIDGRVPDTTMFLYDEDRNIFLGAVNIRHYLNAGLLYDGGHIGDGIRPSERRKGYATKMIALALEECKKIGLNRVLICCDKDNIGSAKQIKNNGGILENEIVDSDSGNIEQRYWIELSDHNRIEGNNIILRKAKQSDLDDIYNNIWNNENVYKTMWFKPIANKEEANNKMLEVINLQSSINAYFVELKSTGEIIGKCGINEIKPGIYEECGIGISNKYQGKGYGKEIINLLLDLTFNKLNGKQFIFTCMSDNLKSKNLIKNYRFKYLETKKEIRSWDNKEFELEYYTLSKDDYLLKDGD